MSHAPSRALERRHHTIRDALAQLGLDALVVTSLPNILYLTNFTGSSAIAVVTAEQVHFLTDFRYLTTVNELQASASACPTLDLIRVEGSYDAALAGVLAALPLTRVGFEAAHLTVSRHQWFTRTLPRGAESGADLVPTEGIVERARAVKDDYEIATLREAARRLSAVARDVVHEVGVGRTEEEVAHAIDARLVAAGFSKPAFDTIVAGGPNSALPHAHPGKRKFSEGDLVVLDFGGVYDSYCVDLTRTVSVGRAGARAREVYAAVLEAHDRAIAAVEPGRSRFEIDAAARSSLAARGLGEAFGHGTGHGLGVEVHEDPRITRRHPDVDGREEAVKPGMVFTIEPGAYLPTWGGVRIEDDVLVTATGVDVLTDAPTDLIEI
ncbi:MAG TPA: Xaa-Pro peptidase family protein [Vicinamibacterales bacterium]|nr:Xaa-Pro peptidase family protein [Vicinamibacterales bacterium]